MTIGIDASRAFQKIKTGTEWYSYHVIREMVRQNQSDDIVLYTDKNVSREEIGFSISPSAEIRYLSWRMGRFWTQGRLSLEMMIRPPDALFVPAHAIPIIHPQRTVTTIHDVGFLRFPGCYGKKDLANLKWSAPYALNNALKIITVSEFTKKEILEFYAVHAKKIHVIHLGYDEKTYYKRDTQQIENTRRKYNLLKPYCITVGRIDLRKNAAFLVKIFEEFKKTGYEGELAIVGPLGFGSDSILQRIRKSPFAESMRLLGWIEEEDKSVLLSGADLFIFPSLYEGFGLPVIEAQACGVPVVCSDIGSLSEILSGSAILCSLESPESWLTALSAIQQNAELRDSFVDKGLLNAKRFNWGKTGESTLSLIRTLRR